MSLSAESMYAADAERAVLSGLFIDAERLDEIGDVVDESYFASGAYREVYRAMRALHDEGAAIDTVTLPNRLKEWGSFDRIGGMSLLAEVVSSNPSSANIGYHADIVRGKSHLRKLNQIGARIVEMASAGKKAEEVQEEAERLIYEAGDGLTQVDAALEHVRAGMRSALAKLEKNEPDLLTGFESIDWQTQGMEKGDLVILAARPSMGKTALAMQFATNVASKHEGPVAVFSLEMTVESICRRMMFTEACVDGAAFRRTGGDRHQTAQLAHAVELLNKMPLYVTSKAATVMQMRGQLRRLSKQTGQPIKLVVIDYLGKMRGSGKTDNRVHEIGEITGALKAMAVEFDCPVVLLCQLSRAVEARQDKRPVLSDLRDSGEIEQDADTVMMLYRPEYYEGPTDSKGNSLVGRAELVIAKQRNGKTGSVQLRFFAEYTRFEDPKPEWANNGR